MPWVVVGLGANLGAREATFRIAVDLLAETPETRVVAISRLHETAPIGPSQPDFLNAAVRLETALDPAALLHRTTTIEAMLGRERRVRWGPRTLDLDLLVWEGVSMETPSLILPHPRLGERAFALGPALEVAPALGGTYAETLRILGGAASLRRRFRREPHARLRPHEGEGLVTAIGIDTHDACSSALSAIGRSRSAEPGQAREVRVLRGAASVDHPDAGLRSLAEGLAEMLTSGFAIRDVSCQSLTAEVPFAFVLGSVAPAGRGFRVRCATVSATPSSRPDGARRSTARLSLNDL